jgi:hypothetical protein
MGRARAHGLDFAVHRTEFLQRAAPTQFAIEPSRPEGNPRLAQGSEIEGMHTFGRRKLMYLLKVLAEECLDVSTSENIDANFHAWSSSGFEGSQPYWRASPPRDTGLEYAPLLAEVGPREPDY